MKEVSEAQLREELEKISGKIDSILQNIQRCSRGEDSTSGQTEDEEPKRK